VGPRTGLDDVEKRKFWPLPGLKFRPLGRPARSQSLYRLHYIGSLTYIQVHIAYEGQFVSVELFGFGRGNGYQIWRKTCEAYFVFNASILKEMKPREHVHEVRLKSPATSYGIQYMRIVIWA
jgi:hypothetical protein